MKSLAWAWVCAGLTGSVIVAGCGGCGSSPIGYIASPTKFYLLIVPSGSTANPMIGVGNQ
jgi:hypothetical protein